MTVNVYHLVHLNSLPPILAAGGLYCKSQLPPEAQRVDLSHYDLQERRRKTPVTCHPEGTLHDYVPFYFAPRSPMLYAIYRNNVRNYSGGQDPLVYLVSTVERVGQAGLDFAFSDGHPIMRLSEFYNDQSDLARLDWEVMRSIYWFDNEEHPDRKRRRQAEFLVHEFSLGTKLSS